MNKTEILSTPTIVALQMCSGLSPDDNIASLKRALKTLPAKRPLLVCLPEAFLVFSKTGNDTLRVAKQVERYKLQLSELCQHHNIWLNAGTMPEPFNEHKYYAASHLYNNQGELVATYNKIHLFDVTVDDKTGSYRESDFTQAGSDVVVVDSPFGKIGLTVCYDLRFSGLFNELVRQGADIILVPSAFTVPTGQAHWQPLLAARAIETQCYVVAAAQYGTHENGRQTYGHSIIISPWGNTLSELPTGTGFISCNADLDQLQKIRRDMPVQSHQRFREHLL
ncbi:MULTISPECIES: carbon-nitrogen hydrolase family protein [Pseudoalteromonas]|uniref:Carbon-nitrogen hydrolase family protein n=1 Tax=Pseudoalteromonas distincta TaxID=77608 RepID=A0A4V1HD04_9GAMM|nr:MULTISPECIES: carbon-nitrogen hydrolase family protein [Pseudoalteromonas]MDN3475601.1 carbon-nitrogen hydrolase family protein [Pseudoalteromonas sp. APC 3355]QCU73085.1 carbon-nitrogen hydrolase family protein [Pseudoalteromonas distincta]